MTDAAPDAKTIFGMHISALNVADVAAELASPASLGGGTLRLFVTPNIQHINLMRSDAELRSTMASADLVTCDGFPVFTYARWRDCNVPCRVTGREVVDHLLHHTELPPTQRLFFLVDGEKTADAVAQWATQRALADQVQVEIAPLVFGDDPLYCGALADTVAAFGTTLLFLCVGAPRNELFVARFRHRLPACWALCIGQSVKIALGLTTPPPALIAKLNLEWLWRIALEPRRLIGRYVSGAIGFALAVTEDYTASRGGRG